MKKKDIERQIAKLDKEHDNIENPICFTGRCPICNKIKELRGEK
jgi:hypothetical protein